MIVHLIDGTYELFRHFYGQRRFNQGKDKPFGAVAGVLHSVLEMLSQRVYGLALGYEDLNDHEQLRKDPVFGILAGREELDEPLAGKEHVEPYGARCGCQGPVQEDHVLERCDG